MHLPNTFLHSMRNGPATHTTFELFNTLFTHCKVIDLSPHLYRNAFAVTVQRPNKDPEGIDARSPSDFRQFLIRSPGDATRIAENLPNELQTIIIGPPTNLGYHQEIATGS